MKLHRFALLGFAAGLIAASCTRDPKTANGTALYVSNLFDSTYKIRQLLFIGQNAEGNEVFQRDYRPATPSATDLFSPQTLRILLPDSLAGTDVTLVVYALDADGELAEYGNATATVVKGTETDVTVNMKPFVLADAGTPIDGGGVVDAGSFDASLPDGGVVTCGCNTTCCLPPDAGLPDGGSCGFLGTFTSPLPNGLPPLSFTLQLCGTPKNFCTPVDLCDPLRANTCAQTDAGPRCSCGTSGDLCPLGTRCGSKGSGLPFQCYCDVFSNCDGCCGANATGGTAACNKPAGAMNCGAAGLGCEQCSAAVTNPTCTSPLWGAGVCTNSSQCAGCISPKKCCSGTECTDAVWPTCRQQSPTNGGSACESCELGRSNLCAPVTGKCACGQEPPCRDLKTCVQGADGGYSCQPL